MKKRGKKNSVKRKKIFLFLPIIVIALLVLTFVSISLFNLFNEKQKSVSGNYGELGSASLSTNSSTCTDSDVTSDYPDGKNPYLKGTTTGPNTAGQIITYTDYCISGILLMEFVCSNNQISTWNIPCSNGCSNGACILSNCTPQCSGKQCGDNGCGSTCPPGCSGTTPKCNSAGQCVQCLNGADCPTGKVCASGVCSSVTCFNNSDCGTNGLTGNLFCQSGNVYQNYTTWTCNNPGTFSSTCTNSVTPQLKQTCTSSQTCSNGQCLNVRCNQKSDCGTDGYIGNTFCQSGNVYQNFTTWICNNPGTSTSTCSSSISAQLKQTCGTGYTCSNGQCVQSCTSACTNGQKRCNGNSLQTCADYNSDGCYEWGGDSNCPYGCNATTLQCNGCNPQCSGKTCGQSDGCTSWCYVPCTSSDKCQIGTCSQTGCSFVQKNCDDNNKCTTDSCDSSSGNCINTPKQCTNGQCDPGTGNCITTCTDNDGDYYIKEATNISTCGNVCGPSHNAQCIGNNDCNDNNANINSGKTEVCGDNIDNNCNGAVDEGCSGCTNGQTKQCGTSNTGECKFGTQICTNSVWGSCIGNIEPTTEICDNKDNDCNGQIDNGLVRVCGVNQQGVCKSGVETCIAGTWQGCSAILGCSNNGNCLGYGIRATISGTASYCESDGTIKAQKIDGAACNNNYECSSNQCNDGVCVGLVKEIKAQAGLLQKIWCYITNLFSQSGYQQCIGQTSS